MSEQHPSSQQLVSIGRAAEILGVSVDTIRRWEKKGVITSERSSGGHRLFSVTELQAFKSNQPLSVSEAAAQLGVSASTLRRYETQGRIQPKRNANGERIYTGEIIEAFKRGDLPSPIVESSAEEKPIVIVKDKPQDNKQFAEIEEELTQPVTLTPAPPSLPVKTADPLFIPSPEANRSYEVKVSEIPLPIASNPNLLTVSQVPTRSVSRKRTFPIRPTFRAIALLLIGMAGLLGMMGNGGLFVTKQTRNNLFNILSSGDGNHGIAYTAADIVDIPDENPRVLALNTEELERFFEVNVPGIFNSPVLIQGELTLQSNVDGAGIDIDLQTGRIFASNIVNSIQGQTGDVQFTAGEGIAIDGTTIVNTAPGREQNAINGLTIGATTFTADQPDEAITVAAGSNVQLSLNPDTGTVVISATDTDTDTTYTAGEDLILDGTEFSLDPILDTVTTINGLTTVDATTENTIEALVFDSDAETITGTWEVADDVDLAFGSDSDWTLQYDETTGDQLLLQTTKTASVGTNTPLFEVLVGATPTANQEVFGIAKGTQASNTPLFTVDEDGDVTITGTTTLNGVTYTWPVADGGANDVLSTNGNGLLTWVSTGGVISGDITAVGTCTSGACFTEGDTASYDLYFEGSNIDTFETRVTATDATADRIITLPNLSGTVILSGHTFSGDASGTVGAGGSTSLTVSAINGATLGSTTASTGNVLIGDGDSWESVAISGDAAISSSGVLTIADNAIEEQMLQIDNAASDEFCLTYEAASGNFEWDSCDAAASITSLSISDGTTTETLEDGDTITFAASSNVDFTVSATDTVVGNIIDNSIDGAELADAITLDSATLSFTDGTNTLLTLTDAGTTGNLSITGDLTVSGNDIALGTNTSGFILVADGTNFSPVDVSGDIDIDASGNVTIQNNAVALGTDTTGDYVDNVTAGNGIAVTGSTGEGWDPAIAVDLLDSADSTGLAFSNSGLEFGGAGGDELALIQGCSDQQLLKWDETNSRWFCASGSGTSAFDISDGGTTQTIQDSDTLLFSDGTSINLTVSATDTVTADVIDDSIDGAELADAITLDAATLTFDDGTNTLLTLTDDGTTGSLNATGNLTVGGTTTLNGITYTWPATDDTADFVLTTDGNGNLTWQSADGVGVVTAVGDCSSGDCFTAGGTASNTLYFEGTTADDFEVLLTAQDATSSDKTITLPNASGTVILSGHSFTGGDITGTLDSDGTTALTVDCTNCVTLGTETVGDYVDNVTAGNGISVTGSAGEGWDPAVAIDLLDSDDSVGATSTNSGLEFGGAGGDELTLIQGCSDQQLLKWDETLGEWFCASGSGTSAFDIIDDDTNLQTIQDSDQILFSNGTSIDFTVSATDTVTADVIDDSIDGAELADAITLDAATLTFRDADTNTLMTLTDSGTSGTLTIGDISCTNCITLGSETAGNYVSTITGGSGISGSASSEGATPTLDIDLLDSADSVGLTTSNSGLEFAGAGNDELALIQGCSDQQLLKWDEATSSWFCASGSGTSAFDIQDDATPTPNQQTIQDSDVLTFQDGNSVDLVVSATDTVTADVIDDSINGTELADTITLDAGLTLTQDTNTDTITFNNTSGGTLADSLIISGTSAITDGIDLSDTDIVNAINIGANNIVTDATTLSSTELDVLDGGITLGTDTDGNYVASVSGSGPISASGSGESAAVTISCPTCLTSAAGGTFELTLAGDTGTSQTLNASDTLSILTDGHLTATAGVTDTVTISLDDDTINGTELADSITLDAGLTLALEDAATNSVTDILTLSHSTSGTPAAGLGAGLSFQIEDAGGLEEQASIDTVLTTVTNNSEVSDIIFSVQQAGAITEIARFDGAADAFEVSGNLQATGTTTFNGLTYTWPASEGADRVLSTDGSGNLTWQTVGGLGAGGDITQVGDCTTDACFTGASGTTLTFEGGEVLDASTDGTILFTDGTNNLAAFVDVGTQGELRLYEETANGTNYTAIKSPTTLSGNITYTLPPDDGDSDYVLSTDGTGVLSWISVTGAGAGTGDILAVGTCTSGSCFTAGDSNNYQLYFEGSSADDFEVILAAENATGSDKTITLPDATGTVILSGHTFTGDVTATVDSDGSTALSIAADVVDGTELADNITLDAALTVTQDNSGESLTLNYTDTGSAQSDALVITGAASTTITDALDVSDAEITNAINIGANNIVTDSTTISSAELDILDSGITLGTETSGNYVATVTNGTGIAVSGSGSETAAVTVSLDHLGLEDLTDPNADRIFFWDDSAGASAWLAPDGTVITISGTTLQIADDSINGDKLADTITLDATLAFTDGTNTLLTVSDGGTTGNVNVTGNLTAGGTTTFGGVEYTWPGTIGGNDYVLTAQTDGTLSWVDSAATADVTSVGNCLSGACFDGTSDGGTSISFYDAEGAGTLQVGNLTGARTWTLPDATGTVILSGHTFTGDVTGTLDADGSTALTVNCTDCVTLGTETVGNYTATIADAGNNTITVTNGTAEGGAVTLDVVDVNCTDCLNATEIEDIYVLNTGDTITGAVTLDGSADTTQFTIQGHSTQTNNLFLAEQSGGTDVFSISNAGNIMAAGTTTFGGIAYTWPGSQAADQVLSTDGNGVLSWTSISGVGAVTAVGNCGSGDCFTGSGTTSTSLTFDDADGDGTLQVGNLTGARTWTLPDATGTVILSGHTFTGDVTGTLDADGSTALTVNCTDCVTLGTETVGNYIADLDDAGNNFFTITGTGAENASATIDLVADSIDATELSDTITLDATLTLASPQTTGPNADYNVVLDNTDTGEDANSPYLILRGNEFTASDTELDMSARLTITDATNYQISFYNDGQGTEIASLDESGNLQIDGDLTVSGNDITLGNGEVINNTTDGTVAFTDGSNTLAYIIDQGTTGDLVISRAVNAGGITGVAYNAFSDSGTAGSASSDDDVYIEDILEVDGTSFLAGVTATGVIDFGGATSFEVVNGTSVTTNAAGELALDTDGDATNVTTGVLQGYDGANSLYFFGTTAYPSSDGNVLTFDSTTNSVRWEASAGSFNSFTLTGDTGTPQTITDGETATIATDSNLTATAGTTDTVTIAVDADAIDTAELADTLTLGTENLTINLDSTGEFAIQDGGSDIFRVADDTGTMTFSDDVDLSFGADENFSLAKTVASTVDLTSISDGGFGTTSDGIDGLSLDFTAASDAAVDTNSGLNIAVTGSGDSGDTMRGINIATSGIAAGTLYGANIAGITAGAGTEYAMVIGTGWDRGLYVQSASEFTEAITLSGNARPTRKVTLAPEFPGASLTGDGSSNTGTMNSDVCAASAGVGSLPSLNTGVCSTSGDLHSYYAWTTTEATSQDYDIWIRWRVPDNFDGWASSNPVKVYGRTSDNTGTSAVTVYIYDTANTVETNANGATVSGSSNTWNQANISSLGGTYTAGSYMTFRIHMTADQNDTVYVGEINIDYLSNN